MNDPIREYRVPPEGIAWLEAWWTELLTLETSATAQEREATRKELKNLTDSPNVTRADKEMGYTPRK